MLNYEIKGLESFVSIFDFDAFGENLVFISHPLWKSSLEKGIESYTESNFDIVIRKNEEHLMQYVSGQKIPAIISVPVEYEPEQKVNSKEVLRLNAALTKYAEKIKELIPDSNNIAVLPTNFPYKDVRGISGFIRGHSTTAACSKLSSDSLISVFLSKARDKNIYFAGSNTFECTEQSLAYLRLIRSRVVFMAECCGFNRDFQQRHKLEFKSDLRKDDFSFYDNIMPGVIAGIDTLSRTHYGVANFRSQISWTSESIENLCQ